MHIDTLTTTNLGMVRVVSAGSGRFVFEADKFWMEIAFIVDTQVKPTAVVKVVKYKLGLQQLFSLSTLSISQ